MNRKLLVPGAAGLAFAAGVIGVQAGFTGPVRQPVNHKLEGIFGSDGITAGAGAGSHKVVVHIGRPATDPTFDKADAAVQNASDTAAGAAKTATDIAAATASKATRVANNALTLALGTVDAARATVRHTAGTSGTNDLNVANPVGPAGWNERELLQRTIRFDAGHATAHSVEIKGQRESARMYGLQVYVDGKTSGDQVNVYSSSLQLDRLDIPVVVPAATGIINLDIRYGYFSSGSVCLLSVGHDDAACAAQAPDPEGLARLRPEVTADFGWDMLGRPAGSRSVRTPLY
jgi:hypothetical protein